MQRYLPFITILLFLAGQCPASAKLIRVMLYPQGASLTCKAKFHPGEDKFFLPGGAKPDTLNITPLEKGFNVTTISWERDSVYQSTRIKALQNRISELLQQRQTQSLVLEKTMTLIDFWKKQKTHPWSAAKEALAIDKQLKKDFLLLLQERDQTRDKISALEKNIKCLKEQLATCSGQAQKPWKVTVRLNGPQNRPCTLCWTYFYPDCGFKFNYLFNGRPNKKQVEFIQEATIWQKTGQDWSKVELYLATAQPNTRLTPPELQPWIIRPRQPLYGEKKTRKRIAMLEASSMRPDSLIHYKAKSTYHVWHLPSTTLQAGQQVTLPLHRTILPATFSYLLRPEQTGQGFLKSEVDFLKTLDIPMGKAKFFLQGAFLGSASFRFTGRKKELFWGTDPLVQVKQELDIKKSGQTFLSQKQTMVWQWTIGITNKHPYPIRATLEEPNPQSRDERIKINIQDCQPAPAHKTEKVLAWDLTIPALSSQQILFVVKMSAPKDMYLDNGR